MTDPDQLPAQTPLPELLRSVPFHARYCEETPTSAHFFPVGRYCHEAAHSIATGRARADALQAQLASLADTVAESVRNTCSMPHPDISLSTDLRPHIWSLSYEANNQQAKARRLSADAARADALEAALKDLADAVLAIHMEGARFSGPLTQIVRRSYDAARALLEKKT